MQYNSFFGLLLAVYNVILLTTILGYSDIGRIRLGRLQIILHLGSLVAIVGMRVLLGYLFSRGTGWAYPSLFFNDAIHETTYGAHSSSIAIPDT